MNTYLALTTLLLFGHVHGVKGFYPDYAQLDHDYYDLVSPFGYNFSYYDSPLDYIAEEQFNYYDPFPVYFPIDEFSIPDYDYPDLNFFEAVDYLPDYEVEDEKLGFIDKSEDDLIAILSSLEEDGATVVSDKPEGTTEDQLPILHRRKRGFRSRSRSSSSSRSRSSSSSSSSSSRWRSRYTTSRPRYTTTTQRPTTTTPKPSAPVLETFGKVDDGKKTESSGGLYPTNVYPPIGPKPSPGYPSPGYPSGYPSPGYPNPGYPSPSGYPSPGYPSPGYPNPGYSSSGYPSPGYPSPGYPNPGYPSPGQPIIPSPGYPHSTSSGQPIKPSPGYPYPPSPGYPIQPSAGYPHPPTFGAGQPRPPTSGYPYSPGYNVGGSYPSGYPGGYSGGYPGSISGGYPTKKLSTKEKIKEKIKQAMVGYATYKMHKKMKKNSKIKFINPSYGMGMDGGYYGGFPHHQPSLGGIGGGKSAFKIGKKIIGAAIKIKIAKYALKFGYKAAKLYFEYKLGRPLTDRMIEKFVGRYHRQRTRHIYRENRWMSENNGLKLGNITLGENCIRECDGQKNLTCLFTFHVHLYQTLSRACYSCPKVRSDCFKPECIVGSGRRKLVSVVNKKLPGPLVQVCHGDKVLIELHNDLPSSGITLHFRGQSYSQAPSMEGTPGLTQKPIPSGDVFTYIFEADKPGTHFWHANTGVMRSDGIYGPFIVREILDTHGSLYDVDATNQTILVSEDFEKRGEVQLVNLSQKDGKIQVHSLLINGIGVKPNEDTADMHGPSTAYARINLLSGKRNRVRVISAVSSNCPFQFRIIGQKFSVIYVDGSPVTPKEVTTLLVYPGERFDVVLQPLSIGLYWIEIKGSLTCENQTQYAVLDSAEIFPLINDINSTQEINLPTENPRLADSKHNMMTEDAAFCNSSEIVCSRNLTSTELFPPQYLVPPNMTLYLSLTTRKIHNEHFYSLLHYDIASMPAEEQVPTSQINNLTLVLPSNPLLIDDDPLKTEVCSSAGVRRQHCVEIFCECLHLLAMPLGAVIDVVLINEGEVNSHAPQSVYFHGHNFWVLSQSKEFVFSNETLDNSTSPYMDRMRVIIRDAEELLVKNFQNPVKMNSITVPEAGYSVIRFVANNPGYWLLESSSIFKSISGMGVVFKVGEKKDLPNVPHDTSKKSRERCRKIVTTTTHSVN